MSVIDRSRKHLTQSYRSQIGRARNEAVTPALLLDLDVAKRNVYTMARKFEELPAKLRPHIKVHKSIELAQMTIDAGAVGVACATVWEAVVMATGGIGDVLVANEVVQPDKVAAVTRIARDHRITVTVDDMRNVEELSRAAGQAGSQLEVLIELDVGMGRCGVRSKEELLPIANRIAELPGVSLRGIQAYEGHCMLEPDPGTRARDANIANEKAIDAADFLAKAGHPCADISAGGTGTYFVTGAHATITEVQAGSYVLLDRFHANLVPDEFELALTVLGMVISQQGNTVVLDCGRKSLGIDFISPCLVGYPNANIRYCAEEHCVVDFAGAPSLELGDTVEVMPSYAPTTVNLHEVFFIVEGDIITDIWPINPRGSGRPLSDLL